MFKQSVLAAAFAAALAAPHFAAAADDKDLAQIREQIRQMKDDYETRIRALESRLQEAEARSARAAAAAAGPVATAAAGAAPAASPAASAGRAASAGANAFNPAISLILGGTYTRLSQDPEQYRIQGFLPGGEEAGPGARVRPI